MPTIKQLPVATSVAASDLLPVSQGGTTRGLSVGGLLSSTQTAISLASGKLLGRVSTTAGGPEPVGIGSGLSIAAGSIGATGDDHVHFPVSSGLVAGDEVVVNSAGVAKRMQATLLRGLFAAGTGVSIDGNGTISAGLIGTGALDLTGSSSVSVPTVAPGTASTQAASTAFVSAAIKTASAFLNPSDYGIAIDGVTDASAALADFSTAMIGKGALLEIPAGARILLGPAARLAGKTIVLDGWGIAGPGIRDSGQGSLGFGTRAGTILLTDTGASPFIARRNWTLTGLTFFWPAQIEDGSVPRVFPALLGGSGGLEISGGTFSNNDVVNAYDVLDFTDGPSGALHVETNRAFFLRSFIRLKRMSVESWVTNNQFTPNAYFSVVGGSSTTHLRDYAAANAAVVVATGNGTSSTPSTYTVDGLVFADNVTFGLGFGFRVQAGYLNLLQAGGNIFDGTATVLSVETGGFLADARIEGGQWFSYTYGSPARITPAVSVASDSAPNCSLHLDGVVVPSVSGGLVDWNGVSGTLDLDGVKATGLNNTLGGSSDGVRFNSAGSAKLAVTGCRLYLQGGGTGGYGLNILQPLQFLSVVGNAFIGALAPISLSGSFPPTQMTCTGNVAAGTAGAVAIAGTQALNVLDVGNQWDKAAPGPGLRRRSSDGALVITFGGTDTATLDPSGTFTTAKVVAVTNPVIVVSASGTSQALAPPSAGNRSYDIMLTASCALTLSGGTAGQQQRVTVYLRQDGTAGRMVTLPAGVKWPGGVIPTLNLAAGAIDVFTFTTPDGGATWFGGVAG